MKFVAKLINFKQIQLSKKQIFEPKFDNTKINYLKSEKGSVRVYKTVVVYFVRLPLKRTT